MEYDLKSQFQYQSGYLLVGVVALIVVLSFAGSVLTQVLVNQTKGSTHVLQSKQALYIGMSGLEIAKRDIVKNSVACESINGTSKYTNATLFTGKFTVTGSLTTASSTLAAAINSSSTSIQLTDASAFANEGFIKIGAEYIGYEKKTGNVLSEIARGKVGSASVDHSSSDDVVQSQCLLTSSGGVPTVTGSTDSKQTTQAALIATYNFSIDGYQPTITTGGNAQLFDGAEVINPGVTKSSSNYPGSVLYVDGNAVINGTSQTLVANETPPPTLETSSSNGDIQPDVKEQQTFSTGALESLFFNKTEAELKALATLDVTGNTDGNALDGQKGKVIWSDDKLEFKANTTTTIGTAAEPVVLLIKGKIEMKNKSNLTFYGILFSWSHIQANANQGSFYGYGAAASHGHFQMKNSTRKFTFSDEILEHAYNLIPGSGTYLTQNIGLQAVEQ